MPPFPHDTAANSLRSLMFLLTFFYYCILLLGETTISMVCTHTEGPSWYEIFVYVQRWYEIQAIEGGKKEITSLEGITQKSACPVTGFFCEKLFHDVKSKKWNLISCHETATFWARRNHKDNLNQTCSNLTSCLLHT